MRRALFAVAAAAAFVLAGPTVIGSAHPLGNFTVNRHAEIRLTPGHVTLDYVLDLAEIPTVQTLPEVDADADGRLDREERAAWATGEAARALAGIELTVDGEPVALRVVGSGMGLRPGQGGLDILRLEASFQGPTPSSGGLEFRDTNDPERLGWREVTAAGEGVSIRGSSVPGRSVSDRLLVYPADLLASPLDVSAATLRFSTAGPATEAAPGPAAPPEGTARGQDSALGRLVGSSRLSLSAVVLALAVALGAGALHALAPGHGKTAVAAYLVGGRGRVRHAVGVGVAVSLMHTASVLVVSLLVLFGERAVSPEAVYPWLGLVSGVLLLAVGARLVWVRRPRSPEGHPHEHPRAPLSRAGLTAIAASGGLLPSPTALVVLLGAMAVGRAALGVAVLVAFSVGLAGSLTVIGLVAQRAGTAASRVMRGRPARLLPVLSAAAVLGVGLILTVRGAVAL